MYTAECRVGRLVEARLFGLRTVDDVERFWKALSDAFAVATRGGRRAIICADWRPAHIMAPEVASALVDLLLRGNALLERSAVLLAPGHATFSLQVERLVKNAAHPARRTFRDPAELEHFLSEVAAPAEIARVRDFLVERPPDPIA